VGAEAAETMIDVFEGMSVEQEKYTAWGSLGRGPYFAVAGLPATIFLFLYFFSSIYQKYMWV